MQEQQIASLKTVHSNHFNPHDAVERLEVLCGRHAQVTEHLRELSADHANVQPLDENDWRDLKSQVLTLRHEIEDYKQTFFVAAEPGFFVFDAEATLNFLTLET